MAALKHMDSAPGQSAVRILLVPQRAAETNSNSFDEGVSHGC